MKQLLTKRLVYLFGHGTAMSFVIAAIAALLLASPRLINGDETTSDLTKIQGTWKAVRGYGNGKEVSEQWCNEHLAIARFGRDTLVMTERTSPTVETKTECSYRLDESKTPKQMILIAKDGPNGRPPGTFIYELAGDTLKLGFGTGKDPDAAPRGFDEKEGVAVMIFKRQAN